MQHTGATETLTVDEVCIGIFPMTALAFVVGGMNVIYQIERLPFMPAIPVHGGISNVGYLLICAVIFPPPKGIPNR